VERVTEGTRSAWSRWAGVLVLVLAAGFFSFLNAGERITLNLGFAVLYRISLVGLVFISFLLGMISMFLFSLHHDRQVRDFIRRRQSPPSRSDFTYEPPPEPPT
jgi:hypothetical protein